LAGLHYSCIQTIDFTTPLIVIYLSNIIIIILTATLQADLAAIESTVLYNDLYIRGVNGGVGGFFVKFYSKEKYTHQFVEKARLSLLHNHSLTIYLIKSYILIL
jgi:hypothetical protein